MRNETVEEIMKSSLYTTILVTTHLQPLSHPWNQSTIHSLSLVSLVTLVESNGSLPQGLWLSYLRHQAQAQCLLIEYGTFTFTLYYTISSICYTGDPHLNSSVYQNILCMCNTWQSDVSSYLRSNFTVQS